METLIIISNFLILGLIIIAPILILIILKRRKTKRTLIIYSLISLFVLGVLMLIFAWWSHKSDLILLKHYGYNIDGMSDTEFYGNVSPKNDGTGEKS
jgi:glucan phosphoethanolaminetransferase (alkaline phosphatase superfamily)